MLARFCRLTPDTTEPRTGPQPRVRVAVAPRPSQGAGPKALGKLYECAGLCKLRTNFGPPHEWTLRREKKSENFFEKTSFRDTGSHVGVTWGGVGEWVSPTKCQLFSIDVPPQKVNDTTWNFIAFFSDTVS